MNRRERRNAAVPAQEQAEKPALEAGPQLPAKPVVKQAAYGRKTRTNSGYGIENAYGSKPGSYRSTYG